MANVNLDFSSVPQQQLLDEGVYVVTIKKIEQKVSSTGKDMLFIVFEEEQTKSAIFENYVLTPEALWKLQELLKAAGVDTTQGLVDLDTDDLLGLSFRAKLIQREYEGNKTNSIKKIYAA